MLTVIEAFSVTGDIWEVDQIDQSKGPVTISKSMATKVRWTVLVSSTNLPYDDK